MNRRDFWIRYSKEMGFSQAVSRPICDSVFALLEKCIVEEDKVCISGFGTFKKKTKKARRVGNLNGEGCIEIPEKEVIVFEPAYNFGSSVEECGEMNKLSYKDVKKIKKK